MLDSLKLLPVPITLDGETGMWVRVNAVQGMALAMLDARNMMILRQVQLIALHQTAIRALLGDRF